MRCFCVTFAFPFQKSPFSRNLLNRCVKTRHLFGGAVQKTRTAPRQTRARLGVLFDRFLCSKRARFGAKLPRILSVRGACPAVFLHPASQTRRKTTFFLKKKPTAPFKSAAVLCASTRRHDSMRSFLVFQSVMLRFPAYFALRSAEHGVKHNVCQSKKRQPRSNAQRLNVPARGDTIPCEDVMALSGTKKRRIVHLGTIFTY